MNKIQLSEINKCFGDKFCLKDINLEVNGGEIFAFIGSNGSGKTTTIRIILGLMEHDSGSVNISNGEEYFSPKRLGLVLEDEKPFEECEKCKYLPICMGGCSRIIKRFNRTGCFPYKNNIKKYLKSVRDGLLENESE